MSQNALKNLESTLEELCSSPMGRRAFLSSLPFLLASCATPEKHRTREGDNTGQETQITVEGERKMTAEVMPQMKKDYPALKDNEAQGYISGLGRRIASRSGAEGNPYNYNFTVVDVKMVNAFALPAGTIFVTAPLISMADSEAELAGVIGHEIGHIKARHTAERIDKMEKEKGKSWLYGVGGGLLGGALGFGLGKLMCPPQDNECLKRAAMYGAAAGVGGGLLIQKYAFMAHSREDEMEADRIGFRTSVAAGYSKDHVGRFYSKLYAMEQKARRNQNPLLKSVTDAMSTHPPSAERVQQMNEMTASTRANSGEVSSNEFDRLKKRLMASHPAS
ncbi:MAG: hypothetical protein COT74_11805 [Bdellovibrionales bacterium CG10_big_fil_rev_8_21_14_0_10_45_34]|nr:MAG: hypothetical protein COT74_11805 [Bdellovibrionales bacterium CG10_big_fil_rev_8_21_14_0_10_45_34]